MRPLRYFLSRLTIAAAIVVACFLVTTGLVLLFWHPVITHANSIQIVDATYGGNCAAASGVRREYLVKRGNATASVMQACQNTDLFCPYIVDQQLLGDPAVGCNKDFEAHWRCGHDPTVHQTKLQPEAHREIAWLGCSEEP